MCPNLNCISIMMSFSACMTGFFMNPFINYAHKVRRFYLLFTADVLVHGVRFAHLFSFLCCPIMCFYVLNSVLWCPLRFLCIKTMFGPSLLSGVCRRAHVLFTLFVFVCALWCPTHILFCFSSSCVSYVASFSRLSILIAPSVSQPLMCRYVARSKYMVLP